MKTVLAHGVFDVLHPGHIAHLLEAKAFGDRLVVSVTDDPYVNKGPGRPVFAIGDRVQMLEALRFVDAVVISCAPSAINSIGTVRPNVYAKGPEYKAHVGQGSRLDEEIKAVCDVRGEIRFTQTSADRTTDRLETYRARANNHTYKEATASIREKYEASDVTKWLDQVKELKVAVIGERITDEYVWVEPKGRSAKEALVTWHVQGHDRYSGGAGAVLHHVAGICPDAYPALMSEQRITKTKYVHRPFMHKIASYVDITEVDPTRQLPDLKSFDMAIVADFGHGLLDAGLFEKDSIWHAVTAQANSLNWGFNDLRKYPYASYAVLDRDEMRLTLKTIDIQSGQGATQIVRNWERMEAVVVTRGHDGASAAYDGQRVPKVFTVPALATKVVDRVGAGDAFLAISAPFVRVGAPLDVAVMYGSIAAAIQVGVVGNERSVTREEIERWVKNIYS